MSKQRSVHLFNCDRTYKLDAVEDWLKAAKPKVGFEMSVKQHYFPLAKMSEMSNETIPGLHMDLAVFVVHAHESRLSINEPNAGIGYAKIYRALLQATENVIIVIGGDDNYKNEDEEDKEFISRWAKRKVSSQFSEEYMDGRKSFIFSWNQKHRDIHEEALRHFFDSRKKGQKFERRLPAPKPLTPPLKAQDKGQSTRLHSSLPGRTSTKDPIATLDRNEAGISGFHGRSNQVPRPKEVSPSSVGKTLHEDLAIIGCMVSQGSVDVVKRVFDKLRPSLNISTDITVKNFSPVEAVSYLLEKPPRFCVLVVDAATVQDAYKEIPRRREEYERLLTTAANNVGEKVIVMICGPCSLPSKRDEAIFAQTIESVLRDKGFIVSVKDNRIALEPDVLLQMILSDPTSSFENTQLNTISQAAGDRKPHAGQQGSQITSNRPQGTLHHPLCYETNVDQLENASMQPSAPPSCNENVPLELKSKSKTNQNVSLSRPTSSFENPQPNTSYHGDFSYPTKPASAPLKGECVVLKTRLSNGVLSDRHVEISRPGFILPDYVNESLYQEYANIPEAVVKIIQDKDGKLRWLVDVKNVTGDEYFINLKADETVVLITRVRYGQISLEQGDVRVHQQNWKIPEYLKKSVLRDYKSIANGELYVISDENEKLRIKVFENKGRIASGIHKAGKMLKETFTFK